MTTSFHICWYLYQCEQALLREVYKVTSVESPLSDAEIKRDEDQMVEKETCREPECCFEVDLSDVNEPVPDKSETYTSDAGWIVPINEYLDNLVHLKTEDTKL